jgi:general secretion pathway protein D
MITALAIVAIGISPFASRAAEPAPTSLLPSQKFTPSLGEPARPAAAPVQQLPPANVERAASDLLRSDAVSQAKMYLSKGRSELAELAAGNAAAATFWHDKAVQTGMTFGPNEDSPAKLAEDIRKAGGKLAGGPVAPTGSLLPSSAPAAQPSQLTALPQVNAAPNGGYPTTNTPSAGDPAARASSDAMLLQARKALAVGDVRRATEALAQAKQFKVNYDFYDDSPAKVETAISKFADLQQRAATDKDGEGYRRRYAELQLQQAEDLLRWRELDEAERLVTEAKRQGVNYGPYDAKPDTLMQKIAEARKGGGAKVEMLPSVGAQPSALTAAPSALPPTGSPIPSPGAAAQPGKARVMELVRQARAAMQQGNMTQAEQFAKEAEAARLPDSAFTAQEDRPFLVLLDISKLRSGVTAASANLGANDNTASQAVYNPANDTTKNVPVMAQVPLTPPTRQTLPAGGQVGLGMSQFLEGERLLKQGDTAGAMAKFRDAQRFAGELDPVTQQRLQDVLQSMAAVKPQGDSLIREASNQSQLLYREVSANVSRQEQVANQIRETDPKRAAEMLRQSREQIEKSPLEPATKDLMLRRIDRSIADLQTYLDVNKAKIELEQRNRNVMAEINNEDRTKVEIDEKIALKVNEFNELIDQQRYAEAEQVAKKIKEIAPGLPITKQIERMAKFTRAIRNSEQIREDSADGVTKAFESVFAAGIPIDDRNPITFPDAKAWETMTKNRASLLAERRARRSDKELEIEQRLRTPVSLKFKNAPLQEVITRLAQLAQINMHLDPLGLGEEGVTFDTPVTIDLSQEISLKSALSLILEPLHLSYVIKDEVLKITSSTLRDGEVYTVTYNVADLVIPIPNFVPNSRMGLSGALDSAYEAVGGGSMGGGGGPLSVIASHDGAQSNATLDPRLLGQVNLNGGRQIVPLGGGGGPPQSGVPQNIGFGPGGAGGGAQADFDQLMQLITGTIAPTTWSDVGGAGAIRPFPTNLSLVVSQTQQVHEEIADLLEQLRRLQDLQVTIEVRFISLSDNFYEQMGVDFDFDINDGVDKPGQIFGRRNTNVATQFNQTTPQTDYPRDLNDRDLRRKESVSIGLSGPGAGNNTGPFSTDLDIPFRQSSFTQAGLITTGAPAGVVGGAQLGFAILSDLEAYFFMSAVQNDSRTNVLQAPKVTLFNGQQAFVSDTAQTPFVISVIPVVGDFAAAQQPVIVVLSEGTNLTVQAVVSSDRRFVRLTVVPFFSRIGAVNTFTFNGSSTTTRTTNSEGPVDATTGRNNTETTAATGTTVQLPTFAFTTVTTTVSVPDGGTVLLGGIKRLSEQRIENGVPLLSKIPYVNRLFTNVGTGRATSSLMMMVTPRIIIQEEEEALLGVQAQP